MTPTLQVKTLRFKAMKSALFFGKSVAFAVRSSVPYSSPPIWASSFSDKYLTGSLPPLRGSTDSRTYSFSFRTSSLTFHPGSEIPSSSYTYLRSRAPYTS